MNSFFSASFSASQQDIFFGEYEKPALLLKLEKFQDEGNLWGNLGFYIAFDHHYSLTPLDMIPFAGTGGDGIHFCFLTDFGAVLDLNDSAIVCVSPTNDPPVKLVAKNLKDFLRLVVALGKAEFLDYNNILSMSTEERELELEEWGEMDDTVGLAFDPKGNPIPVDIEHPIPSHSRVELIEILKEQYQIDPILGVQQYINNLRAKRKREVTIQTADDIGIIYQTEKPAINCFDYNSKDINSIKVYLDSASKAEKLKFYRDATYHYILSKGYDTEIKKLIIESLTNDGYIREAKILKKQY